MPETIPIELAEALRKDKAAKAKFDAMPPSHRREYAGYVAEAKKAETRQRRAAKAAQMILDAPRRSKR
jgi:uncharacterized protein YdeI (YjbR/CyaY-like superfamily)